jgi:hypothetical protein
MVWLCQFQIASDSSCLMENIWATGRNMIKCDVTNLEVESHIIWIFIVRPNTIQKKSILEVRTTLTLIKYGRLKQIWTMNFWKQPLQKSLYLHGDYFSSGCQHETCFPWQVVCSLLSTRWRCLSTFSTCKFSPF